MKTIHDLQLLFDTKLHDALERWYEQFLEETGQRGLDLFLAYLAQKKLVSAAQLDLMRSGQPVQLSEVGSVAAGFIDAATSIVESHPRHATSPLEKAVSIEESIDASGDSWGTAPIARLKTPGFFEYEVPVKDFHGEQAVAEADTGDLEESEGNKATGNKATDGKATEGNKATEGKATEGKVTEGKVTEGTAASHIDTADADDLDATYAPSSHEQPGPTGMLLGLPADLVNRSVSGHEETAFSVDSQEGPGFEDTRAEEGDAYLPTAVLPSDAEVLGDALKIEDSNHKLLGELGRGAMGVVFLANEKNLGRKVAFKQIRPEVATEQELMMRFLREAQITAQLDHPAIIPVHALVKGFRGLPAYTMKVVEGTTFDVLIKQARACFQQGEPLEESHALSTRIEHFLKVCDAMAYAHSKGVLHRDLKPKNILVGRFGEAYIVDWGLARLMFSQDETDDDSINVESAFGNVKTQVGQLMGTPQYMSPEQAQGILSELDGRSDLYSLGTILFELVYLEKALEGTNLLDVVNKVVKGELKPVPEESPYEQIPPGLPALIRKATAANKQQRYESVKQFSEALRSCLHKSRLLHPNSPQEPSSLATSTPRKMGWLGWLGWVACVLVICAALGTGWTLRQQDRQEAEKRQKQFVAEQTNQRERHLLIQRLSHRVERYLGQIQAQVTALSSAAQQALLSQEKGKRPTYFLHPNFNPPDLQPSSYYKEPISLRWPVLKLAPKVSANKQKWLLARLSKLDRAQRKTFFESLPPRLHNLSAKAQLALLEKGEVPLMTTFVILPPGLLSSYPGHGNFPRTFQPLAQPWYRNAINQRNVQWSRPFIANHQKRAIVVACLRSFFDSKERYIGMAGGSVGLNSLANYLQKLVSPHTWVAQAQLLNEKGEILVKSNLRLQDGSGKQPIDAILQMPTHHNPRLRKAIQSKSASGMIEATTPQDPGEQLYFTRIEPMHWYIVLQTRPK